jgi:acetyl-CoA acetyltransferase
MTLSDVDEAFVGYIQPGSLLGVRAMKELGLTGLPVTHVENASATGLVAFREAAWAVASGRARVAMAIAFDKMTEMAGGGGRSRGTGRDQLDATILPAAYFALWAQRRMHDRGTKPEHFAAIAAKNWNHGARCPWSDRQTDHVVTVDEVLASRMVSEPLTAMMACPADDGAACVIVAAEDVVRARQPGRRLVRPVASALRSETYSPGHTFLGPVVGPATMTRDTAAAAYEDAGIGPEDVDLALCHDAFANEELEYYELLGFCPEGDGERLVETGATALGGRSRSTPTAASSPAGTPAARPASRSSTRSCTSCGARRATARSRGPHRAGPPRGGRQRVHGEPFRGGGVMTEAPALSSRSSSSPRPGRSRRPGSPSAARW